MPTQLIDLFDRMQTFQMRCASDPNKIGYRRQAYSPVSERTPPKGRSGARRTRIFPKTLAENRTPTEPGGS